jgi:hypothetical protein
MSWRFHEIVLSNHSGVITEWLAELQPAKRRTKVVQKFKAMLRGMRPLPQPQWPSGWTTKLTGSEHILELRFEVWNVQYRPLFFYGVREQIICAFAALEIGDKFVPTDAPERAEAARQYLLLNWSKTNEIDIDSLV